MEDSAKGRLLQLAEKDESLTEMLRKARLRKYDVLVTMKPLRFSDLFLRKPDKAKMLEELANMILTGKADDQFIVDVREDK